MRMVLAKISFIRVRWSFTVLVCLVCLIASSCQRPNDPTTNAQTSISESAAASENEERSAQESVEVANSTTISTQPTTQPTTPGKAPETYTPTSSAAALPAKLSVLQDLLDELPTQKPHSRYVTSAACRECHPSEHASWSHSYHRTMTQLVSDESVAGGFDGKTRRIFDWNYTAEKRGDEYWCKFDATDSSGASFEYHLLMSTGSHHMQKFWYNTGKSRKMGMAPLVYLIEADKWMPESSAFLSPPDHRLRLREGAWNTGCIQCHATGSHPRITGPDEMDPLVAEFGIACEACHGPGEQHVAAKTADTIVNPRNLTSERSSQVCGQCHGAWIRTEKSKETKWSQTGNAFRPGQDLFALRYYPHGAKDAHLHAKIKAVESFWPDGENRVAGREMNGLLSSPCFAHSQNDSKRMSCISCHDLHRDTEESKAWANDQMGEGMYGNEACLQCHEAFREDLTAHTHHSADSPGSLCYNCHMPYTSYGLLKAVRTHTIVSPSAKTTLETGKPNGCSQCHLDETLDWTAKHLATWYGHDELQLPGDHTKIATSVIWSLKGDAAQRALSAWSMGWEDARKTSGENWMAFYLADLMFDEYDAIRYIAYRSLRQISGFESIEYDHLRPNEERERVMAQVLAAWQAKTKERPTDPKLLYDEAGNIMFPTYQSLRQLRDDRPILLTE